MNTAELRELFEKGYGFEIFKGTNDNPNNAKIEDFMKNLKIDMESIKRIEGLEKENYVLCIGESWCPDCVINESIMSKIADLQSNIKIRFIGREGNESLVSSYDADGKARIPLILIMDEEFNVKGTFNEVPSILNKIVKTGTQPEIIVAKRKYRNGEFVQETIEELMDLLEK